MIYIWPYLNTLKLKVCPSRRKFSLLISQGVIKPGWSKTSRLLYRTVHRPTTPVSEAHEELLKVLERYIQSLKGDICFHLEDKQNFNMMKSNYYHTYKEKPFHMTEKIENINCSCLCSKDSSVLPRNQNTTISSVVSTSPSRLSHGFIELGQDTDIYKVTGIKFIISYDPATENQNLYRTTPTLEEFRKAHPITEKEDEKNTAKFEDSDNKQLPKIKYKKKKYLKSEVLETHEKKNYFTRSLCSYIQVCGNIGMVNKAQKTFAYYRYKNKHSKKKGAYSIDIRVYNALLNCWAELGNFEKVEDIFAYMTEDGVTPDLQSCAAYLECLARSQSALSTDASSKIKDICTLLEKQEKKLGDIFYECTFTKNQLEKIIEFLKANVQNFPEPQSQICHIPYSCILLEELNNQKEEKTANFSFIKRSISTNYSALTSEQLNLEADYFVTVKSVNIHDSYNGKTLRMQKCVMECEKNFKKEILCALESKISSIWEETKGQKCMTLYPYLCAVDKDIILKLLLQEIRLLAETAEYFSPNIRIMCSIMGTRVMNSYLISQRVKNKVTDKIVLTHSKYVEYLQSPELVAKYTPREYWEYLKRVHFRGPTIDVPDVKWPHHILHEVGQFLYEILLETLTFNVNIFRSQAETKATARPFYTTYERSKKSPFSKSVVKFTHEIRAHSKICKMYRDAKLENLEFDVSMVPMICPPRPWVKLDAGGLLMTSVPFIRLPPHAHQQNAYYNKIPNEHLFPCFDSLNNLSLCPWIINTPVLDAIIKVFRSGGCVELDVPFNPEKFSDGPKIKLSMTNEEKFKVRKEIRAFKKMKLESGSLWYDCLYKLSIANYFRDTAFWFPHNLDFRGRVYPTPPHFNHLGGDLVRSILLFSEGKPLGPNGLDWLKIHLINLTGLKKREPNSERLRYADEIMEDILDSADNSFTGRQWWKTSDEPWQTLACCMEVAKAVRSPDPIAYISHFPVHQDGSCNGLQHYAALGRDEFGAKEVNLFPSDRPQDVYTGVATLVEEERRKDAAESNEIAKALDGFVKRKVVKQTIMTFVYGVTEYGAKQQILKKLKDFDFPDELCNEASLYLMKQTFASIQKMFTATRRIQKWFTASAELITKISGEPVEWITPLGLPVIQPYHKRTTIRSLTDFIAQPKDGLSIFHGAAPASYESTFEMYQLPNVRKQKNAFAPNFIHSLDSSHMMLTSLFSQRKGITFVSVHDCYWTHPVTVEIMNQVCRQQFVALHNQPILENLSRFFLQKYLPENCSQSNEHLRNVLGEVPKKGSFNLEHVLNSVYFFS